ncbi:hypothetical protein ACQPZX_24090 [Actinoplanes sp. CA-142083]|uniref:hypothetical protein n=1 Tax=Actinoplanes sp. CA-142083 TaxID=3239903 RepID=UPI003D925931
MRRMGAVAVAVVAMLGGMAGPARADDVPKLTAFSVSAAAVDVTYGTAQITVTMSVSDPGATGVGTGNVIAHGPDRGYNPGGRLVQVGGTAKNTQYRADITLPAGKAVDYRMNITFLPFGEFSLVDLQSQLVASGWAYHTVASVNAAPAAPAHLTFQRDLTSGRPIIIVSWDPPRSGQPIATASAVTGTGCGTLQSTNYAGARFTAPASTTTCTVTASLSNSAGSSPATTASGRI